MTFTSLKRACHRSRGSDVPQRTRPRDVDHFARTLRSSWFTVRPARSSVSFAAAAKLNLWRSFAMPTAADDRRTGCINPVLHGHDFRGCGTRPKLRRIASLGVSQGLKSVRENSIGQSSGCELEGAAAFRLLVSAQTIDVALAMGLLKPALWPWARVLTQSLEPAMNWGEFSARLKPPQQAKPACWGPRQVMPCYSPASESFSAAG